MDREEIRDEIRQRLGETSGFDDTATDPGDFWKNSQINNAINNALKRFAHVANWPWGATVLTMADEVGPADSTFLLPDEVSPHDVIGIRLSRAGYEGYVDLKRLLPIEGWKMENRAFNSTGIPEYFYHRSSAQNSGDTQYTIKILPTPTDTWNVEFIYNALAAPLTTDADEPAMPEDYQEAIVAYATAKLWLEEQNPSLARTKHDEQMLNYMEVVEQALTDLQGLADDEPLIWGKEEPELTVDSLFNFRYPTQITPP